MRKGCSQIYDALETQICAAGSTIMQSAVVNEVIPNEDGIQILINNEETHTCKSLVIAIHPSIDSMSFMKDLTPGEEDKFSKVTPIGGYWASIWSVDNIPGEDESEQSYNILYNTNPAQSDLSTELPLLQACFGPDGSTLLNCLYTSEDEFVTKDQVLADAVTALNNMGMTSHLNPGESISAADKKYSYGHEYFYHPVDEDEVFENDFFSKLQDLQNEDGSKTWYVGAMFQWESTWEVWRGALPVIDDIDKFLG